MKRLFLSFLMTMGSVFAFAGWEVDPTGSHIGFASVKNDLIAENHTFTELTGRVSVAGEANIKVTLASVETLIPLRNERMQTMLFNIAKFPQATITSEVPVNELSLMATGESSVLDIELLIDLHGKELKKSVPVKVTSIGDNGFDVSSLGPIIVHASQFALSDSVDALRKIAGLQSIDLMVPVTFDLRLLATN
jgi:polyisoprenoid-binding protein YceI